MRVLVCGGRDFNDADLVARTLDAEAITHVIQGGARGADRLGYDWARKRKVPVSTFNADWQRFGPKAGPLRNQQMLDEGKPDLVIAFPGGRGTADMVRRALAAGVPVREVPAC